MVRLVHSQPDEACITVPRYRRLDWPLVLVLVGCFAFDAAAFYTIWRLL